MQNAVNWVRTRSGIVYDLCEAGAPPLPAEIFRRELQRAAGKRDDFYYVLLVVQNALRKARKAGGP